MFPADSAGAAGVTLGWTKLAESRALGSGSDDHFLLQSTDSDWIGSEKVTISQNILAILTVTKGC